MSASSRSTSSSLFPVYLIPSLPFRRRNRNGRRPGSPDSSTASSRYPPLSPCDASSAAPVAPALAAPAESYLRGHVSRLRCARCAADLGLSSQIISKGFTGRHGRAYLVSPTPPGCSAGAGRNTSSHQSLPNTHTHAAVPRQLVTGAHTVSDVSCAFCGAVVGWKYDGAEEESQRYKVGKFILETKRICADSCWESGRWEEIVSLPFSPPPPRRPLSSHQQQQQQQPARAAAGGGGSRSGTFSVARGIFMDDDEDGYDDINIDTLSDPQRSASSASTSHPHQSLPVPIATPTTTPNKQEQGEPAIEFDSQDEDECEDLFAGIWSPALALKRRQAKTFGGARGKLKGLAAGAAALRGR